MNKKGYKTMAKANFQLNLTSSLSKINEFQQ